MTTVRVAVFEHPGPKKIRLQAYTLWYNETWPGCIVYEVEAVNGTAAKKAATMLRYQAELTAFETAAERRGTA